MSGDCVAMRLSAGCGFGRGRGRSLHDVLQRPIMLDEVKICRGNRSQGHAVVPAHRDRLQENLGKNDRASPVEVDAVGLHPLYKRAKQPEIRVGGSAKRSRINGRVHMWNIRADREMNRDGDFKFIG